LICRRRQTESPSSLAYFGDGGGPVFAARSAPVSIDTAESPL
jgi:hypothetical protein